MKQKLLVRGTGTILSLMLSMVMIASMAFPTFAAEVDPNGNYVNAYVNSGEEGSIGGEGALVVKKDGNIFVHAACIENEVSFPTERWPENTRVSKYADKTTVDRKINGSGRPVTLTDEKMDEMKKLIYVYSRTDKLNAYSELDRYKATWAAVAEVACGYLPDFIPGGDVNQWSAKNAYETLKTEATKINVPNGLELAFFETIINGAHQYQTLVALKLFGTAVEVQTPSIKNTTAKVNDTATSVELASGAEGTMTDEVTFENLETGKEYTVESSLLKDGSAFDTATTKVTGPATSVKVTFKKKITEAGKYQVKTVLKLNGDTVASHNDDLNVDSETVKVTVKTTEETTKDEKVTVKISKTDMNGKEVEGAVIVIKDKDGNEVLKWTSDKTVKSFEVAPGTYTLEETNAPDGYQKVETKIEFEVSNDGSVTVKTADVKPAGACEVKAGVLVLKDAVSASEDTTTDTTTKKKPVISVTKTSDIKKAEVGDRVKYTITVKNSGDADASDVQVVDSLPEGLDYVSDDHDGEADGQDVSWTLDIAAGKSIKISLVAEINEDASGKILNTVKVVGEEGVFEGVSDSANVEVKGVYEDTAEDDDNDDTNTAGSSESGSNSKGSGSPNTGDDTDVAELIALMLACAAGLEIVRRRRIN